MGVLLREIYGRFGVRDVFTGCWFDVFCGNIYRGWRYIYLRLSVVYSVFVVDGFFYVGGKQAWGFPLDLLFDLVFFICFLGFLF